jgi:Mrp family chromosome partitioning ATPase
MAVSDSRILARLVDKTIFVVRWSETRREVAMMGLKQIIEAGASVAGVVLSMVNVKKHAAYGYGDSGAYYGRYSKYYTS